MLIDDLRNVRDIEDAKNKDKNIKVDDVIFMGKATIGKGENQREVNVYQAIEGQTIKYYFDNNCVAYETLGVGIIPSPEYLKEYEEGTPIKDIIINLKQKQREEKENLKDRERESSISLNELEAEEQKEGYAKELDEKEEKIKRIAEIKKQEEAKKRQPMNHLQEIDADTKVSYYKDMEKAMGITGVQKFVIVYSEDAAKITDNGEKSSSRYSMIAVMEDGTKINLNDRLEEVRSEGKNSVEGRIQTDADKKTRLENNPASMYRIKNSTGNETFSFENGQYGEIKVYYGNMTRTEGTKFVGTQLETNNVWPTSREVRDQASDREGMYYTDEKQRESEKHIEHGDDELSIKNADGKADTAQICDNPYIPGTDKTWEELSEETGESIKKLQGRFERELEDGKEPTKIVNEIEYDYEMVGPNKDRR